MNALLVTAGSHGDVHPILAIGCALHARGHDVRVCVHPHFAPDVRAAGLRHVPIGAALDFDALVRNPRLFHRRHGGRLVWEQLIGAVPDATRDLRAEVERERPDVIVTHVICFGAAWTARQRHIPLATATLAPIAWLSDRDPVPGMQRWPGRGRAVLARMLMRIGLPLVAWVADRKLNALRRELALPPAHGALLSHFRGGDVNLGLWSPHLRGPLPGDPPAGVITGFPWYDRSNAQPELAEPLRRFLDAGAPPIIFSLGTAAYHTAGNFYEVAASVCARLGRRGVLLTGAEAYAPPSLPAGVFAYPYAPFSLLLPRGACTVHHGGIGSTAQALRAGRPMVVIPHAHDQFNNGLRVRQLGLAEFLPRDRLTLNRLTRVLERVLTDRSYAENARHFADRLEGEDGAAVAAEQVEALVLRPPRREDPALAASGRC